MHLPMPLFIMLVLVGCSSAGDPQRPAKPPGGPASTEGGSGAPSVQGTAHPTRIAISRQIATDTAIAGSAVLGSEIEVTRDTTLLFIASGRYFPANGCTAASTWIVLDGKRGPAPRTPRSPPRIRASRRPS
jgi:hypothetical protein